MAETSEGLARSTLPKASREEALEALKAGLSEADVEDEVGFGNLPDRLRAYFRGERVDFADVALDLSEFGPFQAAAMRAAQRIPHGCVVTYRELAGMAGSERAARAAGNAMARNPVPIIVPCHRVVASGGKIGGFSSGLAWKKELLKLEGVGG